eukprot:SAG31_NODE_4740_length_2988_cov_1.861890_2_plen_151_part_00
MVVFGRVCAGRTAPELLAAYSPPAYFVDDLFDLLDPGGPTAAPTSPSTVTVAAATEGGSATDSRPDYRWLLIGGARSGQTWHTDPNGTSAWNLTLSGRKRWLFFPPNGPPPPGVVPATGSGTEDWVTPVSIAEWGKGELRSVCGRLVGRN